MSDMIKEYSPIGAYHLLYLIWCELDMYSDDYDLLTAESFTSPTASQLFAHELWGCKKELLKSIKDYVPPMTGIYIYFHAAEKYKIGKAENISRRIAQHMTTAPSLRLIHVIETTNLDWCEGFLHRKFAHKRLKGEYFDLGIDDLMWLCSLKVMPKPSSISAQLSLLDFLDDYRQD